MLLTIDVRPVNNSHSMAGELVLERGGAGDLARAMRKDIMRISLRIINLTIVFVVSLFG